jgi:hypothetical protein
VLVERSPIARTESDQRHGGGISLLFKEQRQVIRFEHRVTARGASSFIAGATRAALGV